MDEEARRCAHWCWGWLARGLQGISREIERVEAAAVEANSADLDLIEARLAEMGRALARQRQRQRGAGDGA